MSEAKNLIAYAGVYENEADAKNDFETIKEAHHDKWIGTVRCRAVHEEQ